MSCLADWVSCGSGLPHCNIHLNPYEPVITKNTNLSKHARQAADFLQDDSGVDRQGMHSSFSGLADRWVLHVMQPDRVTCSPHAV